MSIQKRFTVHHHELGRWIEGDWMDPKDTSALLKTWAYDGYVVQSRALAVSLGAMVAVTKTYADAEEWLREINLPDLP